MRNRSRKRPERCRRRPRRSEHGGSTRRPTRRSRCRRKGRRPLRLRMTVRAQEAVRSARRCDFVSATPRAKTNRATMAPTSSTLETSTSVRADENFAATSAGDIVGSGPRLSRDNRRNDQHQERQISCACPALDAQAVYGGRGNCHGVPSDRCLCTLREVDALYHSVKQTVAARRPGG